MSSDPARLDRQIDDLIRQVTGPEPPATFTLPDEPPGLGERQSRPEAVPARRPAWHFVLPMLAVAAVVALVVRFDAGPPAEPSWTTRGNGGTVELQAYLRLAVERRGVSEALPSGALAQVGERVFFHVAAEPAGRLRLHVESPGGGREEIARTHGTVEGEVLQMGPSALAFVFTEPGLHRFVLTPESGMSESVEVVVQD